MNTYRWSWLGLLLSCSLAVAAQRTGFTVVPLGVRGGLDESNLSAYLVAGRGSSDYICLDAGTLYAGIRKAIETGAFAPPASRVLRSTIKGYFISHPHLDHVAGLIINSPEDSTKNVYGLPSCLNVLKEKYFSWQSWANFGDEGEKPQLKKYHYVTLTPGQEIAADNTPLTVTAFPLSHGAPYESTAFLVRYNGDALLYLGDTGADTVEHSTRLHDLWVAVSPLLKAGRLKALFIEVSFPNEQPTKSLFGHLTPALLMQELSVLGELSGQQTLSGLPVVIVHRKPGGSIGGDAEEMIRQELTGNNPQHVKLIFPEQGKRLEF
jgi:3',5'-cyclic-nucleotide phosphodiesterase